MPTAPRERTLRVLHLEDSVVDHELAIAHLSHGGLQVAAERVESEMAFVEALGSDPDRALAVGLTHSREGHRTNDPVGGDTQHLL